MKPEKHSELIADHQSRVADFLQVIEKVPCGRAKRGRTETLYQAITSLTRTNSHETIGRKAVSRVASEIVGFKAQVEYGQALLAAQRQEAMSSVTVKSDFFTSFVSQHKVLFLEILGRIEPGWRRLVIGALQMEISENIFQIKSGLYRQSIREKIQQEFGVGDEWTNLPKVGLNVATVTLCGIFRELTGGPQCGLVGQLLLRAGLEDATGVDEERRYKVLADRIERRMRRESKD